MNCFTNNNMGPLISVIIPVYNAEKTIRRTLDSIKEQTFYDFEVIMIDDGSTDTSGDICDEYTRCDKRFKVKHKQNQGVSAARQDGIDMSKGEYTIHIDPDDWVEQSMLKELYLKAVESNADMVICDFYENIGNLQIYHKQQPSSLDSNTVLKELFQQLHGSCWNKLVRRVCYNNFDISFPSGIYYCEDLYVNAKILMHSIKVAYLPKAYYHYVQYNNKATLVRYYDGNTYNHDIKLKALFLNLLSKSNIVQEEQIIEFFDKTIIFRAFENGYNYYSSRLFKKRFSDFLPLVQKNFNGKEKFFLILSIKGFYRLARYIKMLLQKVKELIR